MAEAAASSDTEEADRVILECAVCLSNVTNHRALTCQHTFCQKCLEPLVQGQTISCPVCREVCHMKGPDVSCLPRNLTLVALMDKICQNCKRNDKEVSCKHCGKQLCLQCFELCKTDIDAQKKDTQDDILQLMSMGRTALKQVKDDTISVYEQLATAITQLDLAAEKKNQAHKLRYQTLGDELAAIKLRHKQLSEETQANELRQKEIQEEMKAFEICLHQFQEDINHRQKEIKQAIDTEAKSEIERLGKLYKDIDKSMERMESVLSDIRAHSYDQKDSSNIIKICDTWKTESPEIKQLQIVPHQVQLHVDTNLDVHQSFAARHPKQISCKPIAYELKGVPQRIIGGKGTGACQFDLPSNVCVSPISANVILCDKGNHRIQVFDSNLQFLFKFGSYGSGDGQFDFSPHYSVGGISTTQKSNIVVADTGNHRLQVFSEKGEHIRCIGPQIGHNKYLSKPLGIAINTSGRIYVNNYGTRQIIVLEEDGTFVRTFVMDGWDPRGLAAFPNGDIIVADYDGTLELFTEEGEHKSSLPVREAVDVTQYWAVAVDLEENIVVTGLKTNKIHVLKANGQLFHTVQLQTKTTQYYRRYIAIGNDGRIVVVDQHNHTVNIL